MRRSSLFFLMVACLAGCGSDGGKTGETKTGTSNGANGVGDDDAGGISIPTNQGGDGDTASNTNANFPDCPGPQLPPFDHYTGTKTWTAADFTACRTACPNGDAACVTANCAPGGQEFNDCASAELSACVSASAGPCRPEYEDEICCAVDKCDPKATDVTTCLQTNCAKYITAFKTCGTSDATLMACAPVAVPLCLADGGGGTAPGGADAGTSSAPPTGTGTTTTTTLQSLSTIHSEGHVLPLMFSTFAQ